MNIEQIKMRRNLHPTPEAVFAMFHWSSSYAMQGGGSMDFYDTLPDKEKRFCERAVKEIREANNQPH